MHLCPRIFLIYNSQPDTLSPFSQLTDLVCDVESDIP